MRLDCVRMALCVVGLCLWAPEAFGQVGSASVQAAGLAPNPAGEEASVGLSPPGIGSIATDGVHPGVGLVDHRTATARSTGHPLTANVSEDYQVVRLWPRSDAFEAIREALDAQADSLTFSETPLRDMVAQISDRAGVKLTIDQKGLEEAGFDGDTPITADLSGLSFKAALRQVLGDFDLGYCFRNEHLLITTKEKADSNLEKVLYPAVAGIDARALASLLETTTAIGTWENDGGPGRIFPLPGGTGSGVIVSHSGQAHEEIEGFLRNLEEAFWTAPDAEAGPPEAFGFIRVYALEEAAVEALTAEEGAEFVRLCNRSLPRGTDADPDAQILTVGRTIVIKSKSRPFHIMAAQLLAALNRG
jgi:hypothetical protein